VIEQLATNQTCRQVHLTTVTETRRHGYSEYMMSASYTPGRQTVTETKHNIGALD